MLGHSWTSYLVFSIFALTYVSGEVTLNETTLNSTRGWSVFNCIKVDMNAKVNIRLEGNVTKSMTIPQTANVTGSCNAEDKNTTMQYISITWSEPDPSFSNKSLFRSVELYFGKNMTLNPPMYGVSRINARYDILHYEKSINKTVDNGTVYVNHTYLQYVNMTSYTMTPMEFLTMFNRSYTCVDIGDLTLTAVLHDTRFPGRGEKIDNANFTAEAVHIDAYRQDEFNPFQFQLAMDCTYRPSDIVPIIVGCTLAGTVVMVLVAYLIGRRRNRARGYQSV